MSSDAEYFVVQSLLPGLAHSAATFAQPVGDGGCSHLLRASKTENKITMQKISIQVKQNTYLNTWNKFKFNIG